MGLFDFKSPHAGNDALFTDLKNKFTQKHEAIKADVSARHKHALSQITSTSSQIAAGVMGMALVMSNPPPTLPPQQSPAVQATALDPTTFLLSDLHKNLPSTVEPLTSQEETNISGILTRDFGMPVSAQLDGIRLNTAYGLIGQEQHLARFPGDTVASHFENASDAQQYGEQGMAPGLGAWGYFAPSAAQMTQKDIDREKYYIAVQTFLAPGFSENTRRYIEFFKYRKMLVVNPENGKAMVVVIGDAGPGESTGKQLGGSPEVMKYLERFDGAQRGPVLYFFLDDPHDTIPLGPVTPKQNNAT